ADTRSDPGVPDALPDGAPRMSEVQAVSTPPMAASAADFAEDDEVVEASFGNRATSAAAAVPDASEDDLYFDSAPIPGVDLSQTSDRSDRLADPSVKSDRTPQAD